MIITSIKSGQKSWDCAWAALLVVVVVVVGYLSSSLASSLVVGRLEFGVFLPNRPINQKMAICLTIDGSER